MNVLGRERSGVRNSDEVVSELEDRAAMVRLDDGGLKGMW